MSTTKNNKSMFCPLNGFNPPCNYCMGAIKDNDTNLMCCAIASLGLLVSSQSSMDLLVFNTIEDKDNNDKV